MGRTERHSQGNLTAPEAWMRGNRKRLWEKGQFAVLKAGTAFCPGIRHGLLLSSGLPAQTILVARWGGEVPVKCHCFRGRVSR